MQDERNAPPPVPVVIYAAKSTEDKHLSIPGQFRKCREVAAERGWTVVYEDKDEGFSAWSGNRGPGLVRAREYAARAAVEYGVPCKLLVRRADRISRGAGDKPDAPEALVEIWHQERRRNVQLSSALPNEEHDLQTSAGVANLGQRAHDDSELKSEAVREGLARRREERGRAVGAIPLGYRAEAYINDDGEADTRRVIDPHGAEVYEQIIAECELGRKPGETSRALNAIGERTKRGEKWTTRAVRRVLENPDYLGRTGYPQLINEARWNAVQERLRRLDPAAVQARKGGRRPGRADPDGRPMADDFLLRGLAFCRESGAPMRCRRYRNGTRVYRCSDAMEGRGSCTCKPVPADLAETQVLSHFESIVGDRLGAWLAERAEEHAAELKSQLKSVERERERLSKLERQRDRAAQQHRRLLDDDDDGLADAALRQLAAVEHEVESQLQTLKDAESRAAEWQETPSYDGALKYLAEMVQLVRGRVRQASCVSDVNAALRDALAGVWVSYDGRTFRADVRLRIGDDMALMVDHPNPNWRPADTLTVQAGIDATMLRLREMLADPDHPIHRPLDEVVQTEPQTFV